MVQPAAGAVRVAPLLSIAPRAGDPERNPGRHYLHLAQSALALLQQGEMSRAREMLEELLALAQGGGSRGWPFAEQIQVRFQRALEVPPAPIPLDPPFTAGGATYPVQSRTNPQWVQIHALGGFQLIIDQQPLAGGMKPQRRPLELLKMLVVASAPISAEELADTLWPDSDGDTARNCLQVAVHRLRRLLSCEQAVVVKDRKLHLDPAVCWVDAWAFEHEWESLERARCNDPAFAGRAARALALYRGHLFSHDAEQPWMLAARERLRRNWLALVRRAGEHYEARKEWVRAVELYEHALELDPVAEPIYRRLMVCQQNAGERAEALHTYTRCRDQLAATLGVGPSAETQQLYQFLRAAI